MECRYRSRQREADGNREQREDKRTWKQRREKREHQVKGVSRKRAKGVCRQKNGWGEGGKCKKGSREDKEKTGDSL